MDWGQVLTIPAALILRSPLHRPLSATVLLLTIRDRVSGASRTFPVNYVSLSEGVLIECRPGCDWWRHLVGGAPVQIRLEGEEFAGIGEALVDSSEKHDAFLALIRRSPRYGKHLGVVLTPTHEAADPAALRSLLSQRMLVRLTELRPLSQANEHRETGHFPRKWCNHRDVA
ncbi:MAG: hypothetical protein R2849_11140 [Thermomicrobiales bacterium]